MATRINFIDLYSFYNELDSIVIEARMAERNISCSVRDLSPRLSSTGDMQDAELRMAVEEGSVESARRIIDEALKNGDITREGEFRV